MVKEHGMPNINNSVLRYLCTLIEDNDIKDEVKNKRELPLASIFFADDTGVEVTYPIKNQAVSDFFNYMPERDPDRKFLKRVRPNNGLANYAKWEKNSYDKHFHPTTAKMRDLHNKITRKKYYMQFPKRKES